MRIFLPLLILGLPHTCATLDSSAIGVGENHGVIEGSDGGILASLSNAKSSIPVFGSPDTIKAAPQACEYQTVQIRRHTHVLQRS